VHRLDAKEHRGHAGLYRPDVFSLEEEEGRKSEAAARKSAEEEVTRLRAEIDRLKKFGG